VEEEKVEEQRKNADAAVERCFETFEAHQQKQKKKKKKKKKKKESSPSVEEGVLACSGEESVSPHCHSKESRHRFRCLG
jgi:hypothetical protein